MVLINIFLVIILIALTAFFVSSEFAIVKVRSSQLDALIAEGNKKAIAAKHITTHLDEYLSACQLGITITALGLGWLGEPTVADLIHPLLQRLGIPESIVHVISFLIAFSFITYIHVVVGELAPKTAAIQKAVNITLSVSKTLIWFYKVMRPIIWLLNGSALLIVKMLGMERVSENELAHSEEELRILLSESYESGEINQSEYKYMSNIFEFDDRVAREIMVPRTEIVAINVNASLREILEIVKEEGFTRYPVIEEDKDNIIGFINIKQLLTDCVYQNCPENAPVPKYLKPIIRVIESIPIHDLLVIMQKERSHMGILLDEYGGTAGLVTVEDILEEIVGEIRDEFDKDEIAEVRKIEEGHFLLDAKILLEDVNDLFNIQINEEDIDTLGGWFLSKKMDVQKGDSVTEQGVTFTVNEIEGHHILYIDAKMNTLSDPTDPYNFAK
ncbi:CBS domain containing-hemolysin-like protein [Bacillus oleivorans]|uniref:CBS domain containing-hemolysin-like protein n=1 Tax=Bacillus oleivorans TaxID=1448271 RepID=A0A285D403_9BACI|nr:hemolysin family protein [Bacillus oleivorans]SNX74561.1 CBS domain containing-hemolysin-like protein [Bacillus oleivorans]